MEIRSCNICGENKELTTEFFTFGKNKRNGISYPYWYKKCKLCDRDRLSAKVYKYKSKNRRKLADKQKEYHQNHKSQDSEIKKKWYQNNKNTVIKRIVRNHLRRLKEDPVYKLKNLVSSRIGTAIKKRKSSKNGNSITKYLPYTMQELKDHLEKQFEPWMNWNNYGVYRTEDWNDNDPITWKWQIDHIIPHSTFKYKSMEDSTFAECWALSNLRPYSAKQNVIDGVRNGHTSII